MLTATFNQLKNGLRNIWTTQHLVCLKLPHWWLKFLATILMVLMPKPGLLTGGSWISTKRVWGMATNTLKPQRYVHDIMSISKAHIFSVASLMCMNWFNGSWFTDIYCTAAYHATSYIKPTLHSFTEWSSWLSGQEARMTTQWQCSTTTWRTEENRCSGGWALCQTGDQVCQTEGFRCEWHLLLLHWLW